MRLRKNIKISKVLVGIIMTTLLCYSSPVQATQSTNSYTLLSQLPAGSLVKDPNSSYGGSPIIWRVVDQGVVYPGCTTLMTKYALIPPRELNISEPCFPDADTRIYGYAQNDSTLLNRWLNSQRATDWKDDTTVANVNSYTYPNAPSYASEKGFLLNFSSAFLAKIKKSSISMYQYNGTTSEYLHNTIKLNLDFFLPSLSEMYLSGSSMTDEGKPMAYFCNFINRQFTDLKGNHTSIWLRTPDNGLDWASYVIVPNGSFAQAKVSSTQVSVAPMTNLDPSTSITSFDTADGTYILGLSNNAVTGLSLNKSSLAINTGANDTLTATITPTNATNKNVTWASSNPKVATASNGVITAVSAGKATITATTADGSKTATCSVTVNDNTVVTFPDKNLENVIRRAISKPTGNIYESDVKKIITLDAGDYFTGYGIKNITGIDKLANLQSLSLEKNTIADLSPLASLTNLQKLYLSQLYIGGNSLQVKNLNFLANLTNLKELDLSENYGLGQLDLRPLSNLKNLENLNLSDDQINDISMLKNLNNLSILTIDGNKINDFNDLGKITSLKELYFARSMGTGIRVNDISWISNLVRLQKLIISVDVEDLSPLKKLKNLQELTLTDSMVSTFGIHNLTNYLPNSKINIQ